MNIALTLLCLAGLAAYPMLIGRRMKFGTALLLMFCALLTLSEIAAPLAAYWPQLPRIATIIEGIAGAVGLPILLIGAVQDWRDLRELFFSPGLIAFALCSLLIPLLKSQQPAGGFLSFPEEGIAALAGTEVSLLLPLCAIAIAALADTLPIPGNGLALALLMGCALWFGGSKLAGTQMAFCMLWLCTLALLHCENGSGETLTLYLIAALSALQGDAVSVLAAIILLLFIVRREKVWLRIAAALVSLVFAAAWLLFRFGSVPAVIAGLKTAFSGISERASLLNGEAGSAILSELHTALTGGILILIPLLAAGFLIPSDERKSIAADMLIAALPALLFLLLMPLRVLLFAEAPDEKQIMPTILMLACAGLYELFRVTQWEGKPSGCLLCTLALSAAMIWIYPLNQSDSAFHLLDQTLTATVQTESIIEEATPRPTELPKVTPSPSPTALPTATPSPVPTTTPTATPAEIPSPTPTAVNAELFLNQTSETSAEHQTLPSPSPSPNPPTATPQATPTLPAVTKMPNMTNG